MSILQAALLGLVQGLTEFLPISSSGHLVIFPLIFNMPAQSLSFDVFLHLGTSLAVLVYFRKKLAGLIHDMFVDIKAHGKDFKEYSSSSHYLVNILIACIPAVFFGLLLADIIEASFRSIVSVAMFLTVGTVIMSVAEIKRHLGIKNCLFPGVGISPLKAFVIGIFQSFALFPGISRSGSSISGGMLLQLTRQEAAEFSFLISLPVILGAGILKALDLVGAGISIQELLPIAIGFITSFISGYFAIKGLLSFLKSQTLVVFIVYRLSLAVFLIIVSYQMV